MAKIIAMVVRNEMEDLHVEHLSDAQMRDLNPITCNAICDALHMIIKAKNPAVAPILAFNCRCTPSHWEEPELSHEDVKAINRISAKSRPLPSVGEAAEY